MPANDYHFVDTWRVRGTVQEVADVLVNAEDLPRWWPSTYLDVRITRPGDDRRVGEEGVAYAKGWLPYTIHFDYRVIEERYPYGFTITAQGDLAGRGVWSYQQDGDYVNMTFEWIIQADKPILRLLSFALKPIFANNHRWTMRRGEESMKVELARRRAATSEERAALPPPPGPAPIWPWLAWGLLSGAGLLWALFLKQPTLKVSYSTLIRRPVCEVFDFVTNVTNDLKWQPEILTVKVTSPGPLRTGSTFHETRTSLGQRFDWEMRITDLERPNRICIESFTGTIPYQGCRTFVAEGSATRITETSTAYLPIWLRPFRGWLAQATRKSVAAAYRELQTLLEKGA